MDPNTSINCYATDALTRNALRHGNPEASIRVNRPPHSDFTYLNHMRLEGIFEELRKMARRVERLDKFRHNIVADTDELAVYEEAVGTFISALKAIERHNSSQLKQYQRQYYNMKQLGENFLARITFLHQNFNWARRTCETIRHGAGAPCGGPRLEVKPVSLREAERSAPFHQFNDTEFRFGVGANGTANKPRGVLGNCAAVPPLRVASNFRTNFEATINDVQNFRKRPAHTAQTLRLGTTRQHAMQGLFEVNRSTLRGTVVEKPLQPGHHLFHGFR